MAITDAQYIDAARAGYAAGSDDDIEIDDNPTVSRGEGGAFVQAWVWVADGEIEL